MSIYNPNIPIGSDFLSISQGQILQNFNKANSSFGIDHYPFADLTPNNGKHNQVTTPIFVDNPPTGLPPVTAADEPKFYAFRDATQLPVLQYSRGPSNAIPSPLTKLQSTSPVALANGANLVLDFNLPATIKRAMGMAYAYGDTGGGASRAAAFFWWTGTNLFTNNVITGGTLAFSASGTQLNLSSAGAQNGYWTLDFMRLS